jgi:transcriptional regulator with XRE-family HTH domain
MDGSVLGRKIRELRKEKGLTLDELAAKSESSKSYIWDLENKPVARPSGEKLGKIALVLEVTTEFLLDDERTEATSNERDLAFFRKFEAADPKVKQKLVDILKVLDDE